MLKNERKYEVGEGVGLLKFSGKVDFQMGVERTGGFFILSRPSPFPYLVNTWSPFWEKKKKQKSVTLYFNFLLSYIYFRSNFTRYFWSSDVYVIINILYRPSTCNAGSQA